LARLGFAWIYLGGFRVRVAFSEGWGYSNDRSGGNDSLILSFPRKRESIAAAKLLDARFRGHDRCSNRYGASAVSTSSTQ
jgi:hypothetical protein